MHIDVTHVILRINNSGGPVLFTLVYTFHTCKLHCDDLEAPMYIIFILQ